MALFTGRHENKVDKKGRVSLPADYRAELAPDQDRAIYVFPSPRVDALIAVDRDFIQGLSDRIEREFDMFSDEEEDFSAVILADAQKISIDGDGRIVLPPDFIAFADIEARALFVGGGSRFQIWRPEAYKEHAERSRARAKGRTLPRRRGPSNENRPRRDDTRDDSGRDSDE
ncbi:MAG: division/cell wall cluster transcriptional repressor MraZ [Alphaproteobacteria bacterium]|nr:division/cell wall cluster transcriptional repressor MraZ [Alphaproteobacteria bacterium]